ncbi:MAG TPA: hypothetical protein VNM14_04660 [Planctomycetota bacterium]|nr:hypothetical protein [Planctomycetota bacterium]
MRRTFSAAGLAVLTLAVAAMLVVFTVLPIRSCPTCKGVAKRFAPGTEYVPSIACPECNDRGTVTEPRRWRGSLVPPQVTRLLQCWREERKKEFVPCLDQVAMLSGRDPEQVLGTKTFGGQWGGCAVFIKSEGKDFVLVILRGYDRRWNGLEGLALLGMDGQVLDYFQAAGVDGWHLVMDMVERPSKDETVACVYVQAMVQPDEAGKIGVKAVLEGVGRTFPPQPGADPKAWLVRVKRGRFEIVTAPKDWTP